MYNKPVNSQNKDLIYGSKKSKLRKNIKSNFKILQLAK